MDLIDQSLGALARDIPGATRVLDAHRLDFCCGGKQSLGQAAAQAGADVQTIVAQLQVLQERGAGDGARDWVDADSATLVRRPDPVTTKLCEMAAAMLAAPSAAISRSASRS